MGFASFGFIVSLNSHHDPIKYIVLLLLLFLDEDLTQRKEVIGPRSHC